MNTEELWKQFLEVDHSISLEIVEKRKITFDDKYLYIPYYSPSGDLLFTKQRQLPTYEGGHKYLYPKGTFITLYPSHDLGKSNDWILTEGELDALTLESQGFFAVTAGGTTSFKSEFVSYFKSKKVYICFDTDESGKKAAQKVGQLLSSSDIETYLIDLPEIKGGKDIGDYFKTGHTKEEFLVLIKNAKLFAPDGVDSGTDNPQGISKQPLITEQLSYEEVESKVLEFLPSSQMGLKIVLAVAVSSQFHNSLMLWMLLVGAPSSGKTDLVRLIKDCEITYYLDNLTQNAFISGERATRSSKVHDLLPLLDKKCLIIKDWTAIFSLDEKMTRKLLGDLVGIYDKEFTKFSSRRGNVSYSSAFSQLGAITPATLNKHTGYMNVVGPRFLCYTIPTTSEADQKISYKIIFSHEDRSITEKEARRYVSSYLKQLSQKTFEVEAFTPDAEHFLQTAAELMACCRGIVVLQSSSFKNEDGEEVKYYDVSEIQIEEPYRAVQQIILLTQYLAFVVGKKSVGVEELRIIKEVVISSMPADRSQAVRFIKHHNGIITAKELSDLSDRSTKTSRRLLDELCALKVLEKIKGSGAIATDYKISDKFMDFILLDPSEFMNAPTGTEKTGSEELSVEQIQKIFSE